MSEGNLKGGIIDFGIVRQDNNGCSRCEFTLSENNIGPGNKDLIGTREAIMCSESCSGVNNSNLIVELFGKCCQGNCYMASSNDKQLRWWSISLNKDLKVLLSRVFVDQ